MSEDLESLKVGAWTAFAAIRLCKALELAFVDWELQASSPAINDINPTAKSVHGILESEDPAEWKKVYRATKHWVY